MCPDTRKTCWKRSLTRKDACAQLFDTIGGDRLIGLHHEQRRKPSNLSEENSTEHTRVSIRRSSGQTELLLRKDAIAHRDGKGSTKRMRFDRIRITCERKWKRSC